METSGPFPSTRWTLLRGAASPESPQYRACLEELAALYWRPVYGHFRRKWSKPPPEAEDLTQEFFAALCEKDFLAHVQPAGGRFRSYVMAALDNFVRLDYRSRSRQKRGGGAIPLSLGPDDDAPAVAGRSPEDAFRREWTRSILAGAMADLEAECRSSGAPHAYALLVARDADPSPDDDVSYEALARKFGISVTDVTNQLFRARKKLRELVLKRVRDTVDSETEAADELKDLFANEDHGRCR
jgi:RNA polymerase sigma-70 factor (ECF subfamily)